MNMWVNPSCFFNHWMKAFLFVFYNSVFANIDSYIDYFDESLLIGVVYNSFILLDCD